jgi:hypothetical protein
MTRKQVSGPRCQVLGVGCQVLGVGQSEIPPVGSAQDRSDKLRQATFGQALNRPPRAGTVQLLQNSRSPARCE